MPLPRLEWRLKLSDLGTQSLPTSMSASASIVAIVTANGEVVGIDANTRSVRWRQSRAALGLSPRVVFPHDSTTFVILGEPSQPPMLVDRVSGSLVRRWRHVPDVLFQSGCSLGADILISTIDTGSSLVTFDRDGVPRVRRPLPFRQYRSLHPLQRQMLLSTDDQPGRCVSALSVGDGIALVTEAGTTWARGYVEAPSLPRILTRTSRTPEGGVSREQRLSDHTVSARALAVSRGIAFVAFGGATHSAGRMVDMYATSTGNYLGTLRLSRRISGVAASQGHLYIAAYEDGYPTISAYDMSRN